MVNKHMGDVKEYFECPFDKEAIGKQYDQLSKRYEHVLRECVGFADPEIVTKAVQELNIPLDAQFIDFCSGTGMIAEFLSKVGYKNFIGIDASEGMTEKARAKNVYQSLEIMMLGMGELPEKY